MNNSFVEANIWLGSQIYSQKEKGCALSFQFQGGCPLAETREQMQSRGRGTKEKGQKTKAK